MSDQQTQYTQQGNNNSTQPGQSQMDPSIKTGYFPEPPPMVIRCPNGALIQMPKMQPPTMNPDGTYNLPPPPPPIEEICNSFDRTGKTDGNKYINYVLPVIGILFCISLFAIYIYLLTSRKKKSAYRDHSYSLPKMSMAIDDRELMPSNQTYSSSKLGQYKSPAISDFDLYKSPMAANSYSSFTVVPGYNQGYVGNISEGPYMGSQQVMIDPLYETGMNYSRNGPKGKSNRSGNMTNRYAGSEIGTSADPIPNIMLSPIEPTNYNMNTNKQY